MMKFGGITRQLPIVPATKDLHVRVMGPIWRPAD